MTNLLDSASLVVIVPLAVVGFIVVVGAMSRIVDRWERELIKDREIRRALNRRIPREQVDQSLGRWYGGGEG